MSIWQKAFDAIKKGVRKVTSMINGENTAERSAIPGAGETVTPLTPTEAPCPPPERRTSDEMIEKMMDSAVENAAAEGASSRSAAPSAADAKGCDAAATSDPDTEYTDWNSGEAPEEADESWSD